MAFNLAFLDGPSAHFAEPLLLSDAAAHCDLTIEHPCAGLGRCGECRVRFLAGAPLPRAAERELLSAAELAAGWRLACQAVVAADALVELPAAVRAVATKAFGPEALTPPVDGALIPAVGALGLVFDVGTTTLAAALVDPATSRVLATASDLNPQVRFGADVIARIHHAAGHPTGASELTRVLRAGLAGLCAALLDRTGVAGEQVQGVVLCGNATMSHCLAGEDPSPLGRAPYEGCFTAARECVAAELGLPLVSAARAWIFPQVHSHVGGDAVAAALAAGIERADRPQLLIDLGTNSEILLAAGGRLLASSAAAGPAFEGAGIAQGMRASAGAIDRVALSPGGALQVRVRGGGAANGVCGTGLVDAAAVMRRLGVVDPSGCLRGQVPVGAPEWLAECLVERGGECALRLSGADAGGVHVSASDVRQLQLVKGSIAAGVRILLETAGVAVGELERIYLAGAFGAFMRKESIACIGLLPPLEPERIAFLGDAAGIGARMALCDRAVWSAAAEVAARTEFVELAFHPSYADYFAAAMAFPELEEAPRP